MPSLLVIEDGTGIFNANSFASAADFVTYMIRFPLAYQTAFLNTTTLQQEQVLIWASELLKDNIIWPYGSYRKYQHQNLDFPRFNLVDPDGFLIGDKIVPQFIKDAQCQLAFELLKTDLFTEPNRGILNITAGPIHIGFDPNQSHAMRIIPRSVTSQLARYGAVLRGTPRVRSVPLYRN